MKFSQLQTEITTKDETLTNLNDQLNTQQDQLAEFHYQIQNHKKEQGLLEQQNSNLESTIQKINAQLAKTSSELDTQRVLNQAQQKQCSESESAIENLQAQISSLQTSQVNQVKNLTQDSDEEMQLLRLAAENLKQQLQAKEAEKFSSLQKQAELQREIDKLKENHHIYQETNNHLSLLIRDREEKISILEKKEREAGVPVPGTGVILVNPDEKSDEIMVLKKERDDAIKSSERRRAEMQASIDKCKNLGSENEKLRREVERLRQHALQVEEEFEENVQIVKRKEQNALNELARTEDRLKKLQFSEDNMGQAATVKIDKLNEQLRQLGRDKNQVDQENQKLHTKTKEYESQVEAIGNVCE